MRSLGDDNRHGDLVVARAGDIHGGYGVARQPKQRDVVTVKEIHLTRGQVALVDDADYERLLAHKWQFVPRKNGDGGYAKRSVGVRESGEALMHRFIVGSQGTNQVHHVNGNGLDNRRGNLVPVSKKENLQRRRLFKNNRFGYKGISTKKQRPGKFIAHISIEFDTPEEAAQMYDKLARVAFGSEAILNFPGRQVK